MTEKEKMLSGALYDPGKDDGLAEERKHCKCLCQQYNLVSQEDESQKRELLKRILGNCPERCTIEPSFWCDYGYNISVGEDFYANHNCVILDCAPVTFGKHVFIGPNCGFYTAGHPMDAVARNAGLEYAKPITVGDDVWMGGNVCVLPGVHIGSNVVIGAGSVVTRDIPSNCVAVGNPCRVVKAIEKKC